MRLPSQSVVVSLLESPDGSDAGLEQEVLCQIGHALLCEHEVWLECDDLVALLPDRFFFLKIYNKNRNCFSMQTPSSSKTKLLDFFREQKI